MKLQSLIETEIEKVFTLKACWTLKMYKFWEDLVWDGVSLEEASNLTSSD
jgi:hypothetical protein